MNKIDLLVENERLTNIKVSKIMFLSAAVAVSLVMLLAFLQVIIIDFTKTFALITIFILYIIPYILVKFKFEKNWWIKYFIITACIIGIACLYRPFRSDMYFLWTYPTIISCLYFDKKISRYAFGLTMPLFLWTNYLVEYDLAKMGVVNAGIKSLTQAVLISDIIKGIQIVIISLTCIALSKMTNNLLQDLVGAEEKTTLLSKLSELMKKSSQAAGILNSSVEQLSAVTIQTNSSNEAIANSSKEVSGSFKNTIAYIEDASTAVKNISDHLREISLKSKEIAEISERANDEMYQSGKTIKASVEEMDEIERTFRESKDFISRLGDKSSEISKITEIIRSISSQTTLLALNAAIEAARAGEQGKGFAVVATEIRKLAEQSQFAASDIAKLVKDVLDYTDSAVISMEHSMAKIEKGREIAVRAGESFNQTAKVGGEVNQNIQEIALSSKQIDGYASDIVDIVNNINDFSVKGLNGLQMITSSINQQLASVQQIAASVDQVDKMAKDLQVLSGQGN